MQARSTVDVMAWISFEPVFYAPLQSFSNSPPASWASWGPGRTHSDVGGFECAGDGLATEWTGHHRSPNEWASKTTPTKVMPSAQLRTPLVHLYRLYIFIHNITMTYHRYVYIYIHNIYIYIFVYAQKQDA